MDFMTRALPSVDIIGKEGSTSDGDGFVGRLWQSANGGFSEISPLALLRENGLPAGI